MHLFLRVSDVLINHLILELKRQDCIDKIKTFKSFHLERYRHCSGFEKFVTSLGIPDFKFYLGQSSKQLKCQSLTGSEKLKVSRKIQIALLVPNLDEVIAEKIQFLWDELVHLNSIFSKRSTELTSMNIDVFAERARTWCCKFITVYHTEHVTPYIHAMMNHVPEFMRLHSSILPFTQQGLEKYNDIMTKQYFQATSHDDRALTQIMEKQNRLEYLRDSGAQPKKCFEVTCSRCNKKGHNKRTCSE